MSGDVADSRVVQQDVRSHLVQCKGERSPIELGREAPKLDESALCYGLVLRRGAEASGVVRGLELVLGDAAGRLQVGQLLRARVGNSVSSPLEEHHGTPVRTELEQAEVDSAHQIVSGDLERGAPRIQVVSGVGWQEPVAACCGFVLHIGAEERRVEAGSGQR